MGNLYIIRHGQTTCNADAIIQGPRIDAELSDIGRRQAEALGEAFKETDLDALYVSPMLRARQTADGIAHVHPGDLAGQVVPEAYEMDYGDLCGRRLPDVQDVMDQVLDAWQMGFVDQAFPGGESAALAQHRVRSFADRLRETAKEQDVAVVAHGRINRILLATLTGSPLTELDRYPQDNANITHLAVEADGVMLRRINDLGHLSERTGTFS